MSELEQTLRNMAASRWARLYEHDQALTEAADAVRQLDYRQRATVAETRLAEAVALLQSVNEWYHRDGSVGGCDVVMEPVRAFLSAK